MNVFKLCWGIAITTLIISCFTLSTVPEGMQLPIHWNIEGKVDRYSEASYALFIPPAVMFFVLGVLSLLKWLEPRKENLKQSTPAVSAITFAITLFMLVLEGGYIAIVNGLDVPMGKLITFSVGLLFMVIGNYLSKTRSNFFIGIRTPWTLSSDDVWQKTHRLGSKLMVFAGGIISLSCWFISANAHGKVILITVIPAAVIPTIYSWWLWKQEQTKQNNA